MLLGGLVGLIDASDQLQKHLENLKPDVDESALSAPLENWFEEQGGAGGDAAEETVDEEYVLDISPDVRQAVERITDMLQEESSYMLRQATSALNEVNKAK